MARFCVPERILLPLNATERRLRSELAAHMSWANTIDRTARTAPAREGLWNKFLREAGGDPLAAESLRKAHYKRMALRSAKARKRRGATNRDDQTKPGE